MEAIKFENCKKCIKELNIFLNKHYKIEEIKKSFINNFNNEKQNILNKYNLTINDITEYFNTTSKFDI